MEISSPIYMAAMMEAAQLQEWLLSGNDWSEDDDKAEWVYNFMRMQRLAWFAGMLPWSEVAKHPDEARRILEAFSDDSEA